MSKAGFYGGQIGRALASGVQSYYAAYDKARQRRLADEKRKQEEADRKAIEAYTSNLTGTNVPYPLASTAIAQLYNKQNREAANLEAANRREAQYNIWRKEKKYSASHPDFIKMAIADADAELKRLKAIPETKIEYVPTGDPKNPWTANIVPNPAYTQAQEQIKNWDAAKEVRDRVNLYRTLYNTTNTPTNTQEQQANAAPQPITVVKTPEQSGVKSYAPAPDTSNQPVNLTSLLTPTDTSQWTTPTAGIQADTQAGTQGAAGATESFDWGQSKIPTSDDLVKIKDARSKLTTEQYNNYLEAQGYDPIRIEDFLRTFK